MMESRFLAGIAAVGLLSWPSASHRPHAFPARHALNIARLSASGPLKVLRFDYYSAKGRGMIAKAACALTMLSFISSSEAGSRPSFRRPEGPLASHAGIPPDIFFVAASGGIIATALIAGFVLMLGAMVQFAWTILTPSKRVLRGDALHYAIYGIGALVVAVCHFALIKVGPGLLK